MDPLTQPWPSKRSYNLYGGNQDLNAVFKDTRRFIRQVVLLGTIPRIILSFSWRVQLMEKGVKLLDFETVDQMVQVHGE